MSDSYLKMSSIEHLVLVMLANQNQELYGLTIVELSNGRLNRGTIYVSLSIMEDKGFIKSCIENQLENTSGIPRRIYKISELGLRVLSDSESWGVSENLDRLYA